MDDKFQKLRMGKMEMAWNFCLKFIFCCGLFALQEFIWFLFLGKIWPFFCLPKTIWRTKVMAVL